jgi:hypothetical protein
MLATHGTQRRWISLKAIETSTISSVTRRSAEHDPAVGGRVVGDLVDEIARPSREAAQALGRGPGPCLRKIDNFLTNRMRVCIVFQK